MDRNAFDGWTKALASSPNRRAALGALLGAALAGTAGIAEAARKDRGKMRRGGAKAKGGADVSAQAADCLSPGPSSNISGCPYQNEDFSGDDLSGSKMVATNFRGAELVGTNLSSSNAKNAIFREADLTCANLRSSTLGEADFRAADLTGATLKSSGGCNTATFNTATTFCATIMCDGSVRNDDCAGGRDVCCECGPNEICDRGACVACETGNAHCGDACVDTQNDPAHCGGCGNACPERTGAHNPGCSDGACTLVCDAGWADCDGNPVNGCETRLGNPGACLGCGDACSGGDECSRPVCGANGCDTEPVNEGDSCHGGTGTCSGGACV